MRTAVLVVALAASTAPSGLSALAQPASLGVDGRNNAAPWIAAQGTFVAVAWGATPPTGGADVFAAVSRDGGATFGSPVRVNSVPGEARVGGELPPRVALTPAAGTDPVVVVAYGATRTPPGAKGAKASFTEIRVARSLDGGRTFKPAKALQAAGAAGDRGWHAMTLDRKGTAHVMWLDHRGLAAQKGAMADHRHAEAAAEAAAIDGVKMAALSGLYYAQANATAAAEREIATGVCYCCKVAMATGLNGEVYAAWRQVYAGNIRDIAFTASTDGGRTFAAPTRVSDDRWQLAGCPDDGPALAVDASGVLHIAWPTVIGGDTPEGAIFYASSKDGRTFTPRQRVPTLGSPKPSHPQIVVAADGRVLVGWDESLQGVRTAAARDVHPGASGTATFGRAVVLGAGDAAIYPMMAATDGGLVAVWTKGRPGVQRIAVDTTSLRPSSLTLPRPPEMLR